MPSVHQCVELLNDRGHSEYGGEPVTQLEHALQSATLADREGASPQLIAAALLHDIGHLLHALPNDAPESGIDDVHEDLGHRYLTRIFGDAVTEPVRLHVAAKRYLCATDRDYHKQLSEPSIVSLGLQGGPMSPEEVAEFDRNPYAKDALRLRRWDDEAKIPEFETPSLEYFRPILEKAIS